MGRVVHMTYSSSLSSLCEINSSFDTGVLRIAYTGANRNGSFISKDTFERCIRTLYNCPIVCHYDRDADSIGGHDMELVSGEDGSVRLVNMTVPIGVIPESSKHFWSVVEEEDGTEREYLCADVLIWKRQEAYRKIKEDGITAHSMELTVKDGEMDGGLFIIKDFEFTAFCLLGDEHEPCFESSALSLFSYDDMKRQMADMMSDLKKEFSLVVPPTGDIDKHQKDYPMEGGKKVLNEKLALIEEFGLNPENLEFSIEDLTLDELREKCEEMKCEAENAGEASADNTESAAADSNTDSNVDFALAGQILDEIYNALRVEKIECCWGEMARYHYVDHDHEALQVYCYDAEDWKLYGFAYSMNGDNVVIDFESKKRMKFAIVDFDEGEQATPFAGVFEEVTKQYTENDTEWSEKYQAASDTITSMNEELGSLRQFKTDTENAAAAVARDEVFAQFEDLVGVEEFDALRDNCAEYELSTLEEKCFAIRGRVGTSAKFTHESKTPKLKVDKTNYVNEPYGGLFARYGHTDNN